jgi:CBS domain-containing protein
MKMMAQHVMSREPACCLPDTGLREVAQMMVDHDCGSIPVVEDHESKRLLGIITDRDIVCRTIAQGKNPVDMTAQECMSRSVVTVPLKTFLDDCCALMEENQVRRLPVIDEEGRCCGIVTQAHISRYAKSNEVAQVLKEVSEKTKAPSRVAMLGY